MAQSLVYRDVRRQLLTKNPYFQQDLIDARRRLGLPEAGFDRAVQELREEITWHSVGYPLGKLDLVNLKEKACQLGLPLEDWLAEREAWYASKGKDFEQVVEERGWSVLQFWGYALFQWWVALERNQAGLGPLTIDPLAEMHDLSRTALDPRLP